MVRWRHPDAPPVVVAAAAAWSTQYIRQAHAARRTVRGMWNRPQVREDHRPGVAPNELRARVKVVAGTAGRRGHGRRGWNVAWLRLAPPQHKGAHRRDVECANSRRQSGACRSHRRGRGGRRFLPDRRKSSRHGGRGGRRRRHRGGVVLHDPHHKRIASARQHSLPVVASNCFALPPIAKKAGRRC